MIAANQQFSTAPFYKTIIEKAVGGFGNDTITGNEFDNDLNGRDGNDSLTGGAGDDTLTGAAATTTSYSPTAGATIP